MSKLNRSEEISRIFYAIRSMHQRNRTVANLYGFARSLAEGHATAEVMANPNIPASMLGKRLGLSPVATARLLKVTANAGLIRWKTDLVDRRIKRLLPGPKAESLLEKTIERNVATFGAAYERLSTHGRRKFQNYLTMFCDGWAAPPASVFPGDPPLMMEIRRLTRALGLLADRLSFAPWCTPLTWHVLTMARDSGNSGVSSAVLSSGLAAPQKTVEDLLRTLRAKGMIRRGRKVRGVRSVFITGKGVSALSDLEEAACRQFERCLQRLSTEQVAEFATLWEHYSGRFVTPLVQAITKGTILQCIQDDEARSQARRFIIEQRVRQKLMEELPATFVAPESIVFVLYRFRVISAALELVQTSPGEWSAANFLIDPSQISNNTIRQLLPILTQNALLITSAKRLILPPQNLSKPLCRYVAPLGESVDLASLLEKGKL